MRYGISETGWKRLAQQVSDREIVDLVFSNNADGWYFHAAKKPVLERDTGYVTLFVEANEMEKSAQYGNIYNFFNPDSHVSVLEISEEVREALQEGYEDGTLPHALDQLMEFGELDKIIEGLDPSDIVNSAETWDNPDFVMWFSERFPQYTFVITEDGGASPYINDAPGQLISMTEDEFDQIWESL